MPWTSIVMFILSFLMSKSKGKSTAQAAGVAALAAGATYLLADPANSSNLLGLGTTPGSVGAEKVSPGDTSAVSGVVETNPADVAKSTAAGTAAGQTWYQATLDTVGSTLKSWGGVGTAAVIGTTGVVAGGSATKNKYLLWGGLALAAYLILK